MSQFDPDFRFFNAASGYRNCFTDHEAKFSAFKDYVCNGTKSITNFADSFVIQFVCHPNFAAHIKIITYYTFNTDSGEFTEICSLPGGYKRANSFKNYKSSAAGHPKGLFYEVNLYISDGRSSHHTSLVGGSAYSRKSEHDQSHGMTKGRHWLGKKLL